MDLAQLDRSVESAAKTFLVPVWRHKFIAILTAGVVFCGVMVIVLSLQPVYEGSTLLISGQSGLESAADGARKPAETPAALTRIAESEEVVTSAIEKVGLKDLALNLAPNASSLFDRMRQAVFTKSAEPERQPTQLDAFLPRIKLALGVRTEPNSDVIRIAFRHRDPVVAAQFANAVAQAFVDRQILLYSKPGAVDFFTRQQKRFQDELKRNSDELDQFSTRTGLYSSTEQEQLLLKQRTDVETALSQTRGLISSKIAERQTLADELRKLAPVARSTYVSALVDSLGGDRTAIGPRAGESRSIDDRASDPPLLLVRVYQDSMAALFKINADLAGAQGLQTQQGIELARVNTDLNGLAVNEQEYLRLRRAIDRTAYNADLYAKRAVEEEIAAESRAARFSSVKVLQKATVPLRPASPNYIAFTLMAAIASVLVGCGAALLRARIRAR